MAKDPVCGMEVDEAKASGSSTYKDKNYYFCASHCKKAFDANPEQLRREGLASYGRLFALARRRISCPVMCWSLQA